MKKVTVTKEYFETSDGNKFEDENIAKKHQEWINKPKVYIIERVDGSSTNKILSVFENESKAKTELNNLINNLKPHDYESYNLLEKELIK